MKFRNILKLTNCQQVQYSNPSSNAWLIFQAWVPLTTNTFCAPKNTPKYYQVHLQIPECMMLADPFNRSFIQPHPQMLNRTEEPQQHMSVLIIKPSFITRWMGPTGINKLPSPINYHHKSKGIHSNEKHAPYQNAANASLKL